MAYTITNSSTGSVTIKDSASTTIDTVVTGGSAILVLTANGTSAGTWVAYSYVPSSYDFSASTANFGTATITNATYQGNTIASGYGGTGLTTFTAANNALYSTSSSALAAGTLPIAAGGTSATTANSAFNALAPSQATNTGKYLKTDGSNTSWSLLPSYFPVLTNAGSTVNISVANGYFPVLNNSGSTTNVTVY